jgi:3',5'-cyclic-AMP phosphodiesterase
VRTIDGLRIITLDTSVPGYHHGEITAHQLDWLAEQLATPALDGTILALHHPPIPSVLDLAVTVELRDQASLGRVLRGSDVRAILGGHLHYSTSATFVGIPVSVASATCYTQDLTTAAGGTRGRDGAQGCNIVHVYQDTIVHSVVPLGTGITVGTFVNPAQARGQIAENGLYIEPSLRDSLFKQPSMVLTSWAPAKPRATNLIHQRFPKVLVWGSNVRGTICASCGVRLDSRRAITPCRVTMIGSPVVCWIGRTSLRDTSLVIRTPPSLTRHRRGCTDEATTTG